MKATLTVRLDEEVKNQLEKISAAEKRPVSDLVRESVEHYVAIHQFRNLRKKVLPFAESQGLLTDEDIFKLIS
jgi:predicted transcriptional regulator